MALNNAPTLSILRLMVKLASAPPTIREALHAKGLGGTALGDPTCRVVSFTVLESEASTPRVG